MPMAFRAAQDASTTANGRTHLAQLATSVDALCRVTRINALPGRCRDAESKPSAKDPVV